MLRDGDSDDSAQEGTQDLSTAAHQGTVQEAREGVDVSGVVCGCRTRARQIQVCETAHLSVWACCGSVWARSIFFRMSPIWMT